MNLDFFPYKLIGNFNGETTRFVTPTEEKNYFWGLENLDETWPYRTIDFNYKFNSHGHRSVELDELSDDYFLITGCSHTLGVGLQIEDSYPYKLSKLLGCQYYNLAINGVGPDITFLNLLIFLSKIKHKPKFILIQWPDPARQFFLGNDITYYFSPSINYKSEVSEAYKILTNHNISTLQNIFYRNIITNFLVSQNIPVFEFLFSGWIGLDDKVMYPEFDKLVKTTIVPIYRTPELDKARDLVHYGIKSNESWAKSIYDLIK